MKRYGPEIRYIGNGYYLPYLEEVINGEYVKAEQAEALLAALKKAVTWNWIDADMPADVIDEIYKVIKDAENE